MRPYNPPMKTCIRCFKPQPCTCAATPQLATLHAGEVVVPARPVWKPIGEASASFDSLGMFIEQIDGYRVPVARHTNIFATQQAELQDLQIQNRIQRDIVRESFRMAEAERAEGRAEEAAYRGDMEASNRLREDANRLREDAERYQARRDHYKLYAYEPMTSMNPFSDFNW